MNENISLVILRSYPLLDTLQTEDLEWLQTRVRKQSARKDSVLLIEGEFTSNLFFILSGWVKAEKTSHEGRQQTIRYIGSGEILNELAVFSQDPNPATVIVLENTDYFFITKADIDLLLCKTKEFSHAVITSLSERIQHLLTLVENLSLYSVETRLARYLLEESKCGIFDRQSWKTQTEIAARLGTVLDVINRYLQKFAKLGFVQINRDKIIIIDRHGLERIAAPISETTVEN